MYTYVYTYLNNVNLFQDVNTKATKKSPKFIWLSDHESNDSSIVTTGGNSQANDPNWSARSRSQNHTVFFFLIFLLIIL